VRLVEGDHCWTDVASADRNGARQARMASRRHGRRARAGGRDLRGAGGGDPLRVEELNSRAGRVPLDPAAAEEWIRAFVEPVGEIQVEHEEPWATVLRVPLADGGAWFKACAAFQWVEPPLTAHLFEPWRPR